MSKRDLPHDHGEALEIVLRQMPGTADFSDAAAVFQQMGDTTRLRILWLLCHCEECGVNLSAAVDMTPAAVAHHLKTLKLGGLISSRREGKEVYYTLEKTEKARLIHQMIDAYFQLSCPNLGIVDYE